MHDPTNNKERVGLACKGHGKVCPNACSTGGITQQSSGSFMIIPQVATPAFCFIQQKEKIINS